MHSYLYTMHYVIVGGDGQGGSRGRQTRPGADGGLEEELEISSTCSVLSTSSDVLQYAVMEFIQLYVHSSMYTTVFKSISNYIFLIPLHTFRVLLILP